MIVNKRQLADILGTTEETLTQWAKQGMPILLKRLGREGNQYETAAVISWLDARHKSDDPPTDYETERTRKVKLEADILALEKAQLEGHLIPSEKVEASWIGMISAFRAKMIAIPYKYAPLVAGKSFIEVETLLTDAIHAALEELYNDDDVGNCIKSDLESGTQSDQAATEADGERVGESVPTTEC